MKSLPIVLFGVLLVLAAIDALPASESLLEKVREKTKADAAGNAAAVNIIADVQKPAVPDAVVVPPLDPTDNLEKKLQGGPPGVQPEELLQEGAQRVKKQACQQDLYLQQQQNAAMRSQQMAGQKFVLVKNEPVEMTQQKMLATPMQQQRTYEPVISLAPLSVNSAPAMTSSLHATYASPGFASQGFATPGFTSPASSFQIAQPALLPAYSTYQQHRPTYQHTDISLRHPTYVELVPEVVYYDDRQSHLVPVHDEPISLYCQPLKTADHGKTLPTAMVTHGESADGHEKKLNSVEKSDEPKDAKKDDKDVKDAAMDQISKVDKIKEEISQLNTAAQKIAEQQEQLTRMQEDHLARSANMGIPIIAPMHPEMPYVQPYVYPFSHPYGHGHYPHGHHYRQNEDIKPEAASSGPKAQAQDGVYPFDTSYRYAMPGAYSPAYLRSETGFSAPNMFYNPAAFTPYTATPEDVEFFVRMLNVGKKMGVIAKDYQPAVIKPLVDKVNEGKEEVKPHKEEDAIAGLLQGADQKENKTKPAQADLEVKAPPKVEKKGTKRDSRSLIMQS